VLCITANSTAAFPGRVRNGHSRDKHRCPVYPRARRFAGTVATSASCQQETSGGQCCSEGRGVTEHPYEALDHSTRPAASVNCELIGGVRRNGAPRLRRRQAAVCIQRPRGICYNGIPIVILKLALPQPSPRQSARSLRATPQKAYAEC